MVTLVFTEFADIEGRSFILRTPPGLVLEKKYIVCEHCLAMEKVLTDLVGEKVSRVIMMRVTNQLHGQSGIELATQVTVEPLGVSPSTPAVHCSS